MTLFKKKDVNLEDVRDIADDVIESDFIPYACHFNDNTILTKNGELLQTLKIVGFSYEHVDNDEVSLREMLRKAILENIPSSKFALWIHTIRRKSDLTPKGQFPDEFTTQVNDVWQKKNDWGNKFTNELYVTIAIDGQSSGIASPKDFFRGIIGSWLTRNGPLLDHSYRYQFLQQAHTELDNAVLGMLATLEPFGAKRLGVYKKDEVYYSEMLEFLGKIVNLKEMEMPLPEMDLSKFLPQQDVTFGHNAMEVRTHDGRRRFGSIITIKEYKELSLNSIDYFLQIPMEFVISQCITFLNSKKAAGLYAFQNMLTEFSGDKELAKMSGLEDIINSDRGRSIDYGEQQLTVFLISEDLKQLERFTGKAVSVLGNFGIVGIREDIKFEECYWALLPGNFEFLKRLRPINTSRIGGFANLSNFPAGRAEGNHWGHAISLLYTAAKTPYFFNFHVGKNGHTVLMGQAGTGRTVLLNFLLSQARKINYRLYYFDQEFAAKRFLEKIGARYHHVAPKVLPAEGAALTMHPLGLKDTPDNRNFLYYWLLTLSGNLVLPLEKPQEAALKAIIGELMATPAESRNFSLLAGLIARQADAPNLELDRWKKEGELGYLFDNGQDNFDTAHMLHGINLSAISADRAISTPVMYYLIHRINQSLDGKPTIIVLDDAWRLLDNPLLGPSLAMWLDMLQAKNAMVIFTTSDIESAGNSGVAATIRDKVATQLYMPDDMPGEHYQQAFGLSEKEIMYLGMMETSERHFLLKRMRDSIVVELDLQGMDEVLGTLSKTDMSTAYAEPVLQAAPVTESAPAIFGNFGMDGDTETPEGST